MSEETYGGRNKNDWQKAASAGDMRYFYDACKQLAGDKTEWIGRWAEALIPADELETLQKATKIEPPCETNGKPIPETEEQVKARFARMEEAKTALTQRIEQVASENKNTLDVKFDRFNQWRMELFTKAIAHNPLAAFYNAQEIIAAVGTEPLVRAAENSQLAAAAAIACFAHYGYVGRDVRLSQMAEGYSAEDTITNATHEVKWKLAEAAQASPKGSSERKEARRYDMNTQIGMAAYDQRVIQEKSPQVHPWAKQMVLDAIKKYPPLARDQASLVDTLPFAKEAHEAAGEHRAERHAADPADSTPIWGPEQQRLYVEKAYAAQPNGRA